MEILFGFLIMAGFIGFIILFNLIRGGARRRIAGGLYSQVVQNQNQDDKDDEDDGDDGGDDGGD